MLFTTTCGIAAPSLTPGEATRDGDSHLEPGGPCMLHPSFSPPSPVSPARSLGTGLSPSDDPQAEDPPGDHEALDLAGALPDLGQLRVAHEPLNLVFLDVAIAAVDLDSVVRGP